MAWHSCFIFLSVDVDNNNAQFGDGEVVQHDPEKDDYWVREHEKNTKSLVDQFGQNFAGCDNHDNGDGECDTDDSCEVVMVEIVFWRNWPRYSTALFQLSISDGAVDCVCDDDVDIVGEGVDDGVGDGVVGDVDGDDVVGEGVDDGVGDGVIGDGVVGDGDGDGDGDDVVWEGVGDVCVTDRDTQARLLPFQLSRKLARDTPRMHPVYISE